MKFPVEIPLNRISEADIPQGVNSMEVYSYVYCAMASSTYIYSSPKVVLIVVYKDILA
jgi:hypothetical protein